MLRWMDEWVDGWVSLEDAAPPFPSFWISTKAQPTDWEAIRLLLASCLSPSTMEKQFNYSLAAFNSVLPAMAAVKLYGKSSRRSKTD